MPRWAERPPLLASLRLLQPVSATLSKQEVYTVLAGPAELTELAGRRAGRSQGWQVAGLAELARLYLKRR